MCDYCNGSDYNKDIISEYNMTVSLIETSNGIKLFINGCDYKPEINFCPMCGRKLTTFEVNL